MPIGVCSMDTLQNVVSFLDNYAEEHAVGLLDRVPGFKRSDIRLLPLSNTKASICRLYEQFALTAGLPVVSYSKFVDLWDKTRPQVRSTKPMTDLRYTFQKHNTRQHLSLSQLTKQREDWHCSRTRKAPIGCRARERSLYESACNESNESIKGIVNNLNFTTTRTRCSFTGKKHYSFDFAQQAHLLSICNLVPFIFQSST